MLPVRALFYTVSDKTWWLVGVQLLDGVGAASSGWLTGAIVDRLGYGAGVIWSAIVAAAACLLVLLRMPETAPARRPIV